LLHPGPRRLDTGRRRGRIAAGKGQRTGEEEEKSAIHEQATASTSTQAARLRKSGGFVD
jgi:hypothetical protein